jgi:maltooligosyltrehalose trehalohydrolase
MHIGAIVREGRCDFRVHAPFAGKVSLELTGRNEMRPMERQPGGYWFLSAPDVGHGERYRYKLGDGPLRPDPASFFQPETVHGPSQVWDHGTYSWGDATWRGLPPEEWILYELHAGAFTPEGTLAAVTSKLPHLRDLGVNAVEIMPVAQFPGRRNWGYDGVYPFAVQNSYGGPDSFKRLVDACHAQGLAVVLDVVYNHMGPEGNYLHEFGPYFTEHYRTPWGRALNLDGAGSDLVREFLIANALYWFREFHVDALRLDAVHQIYDTSARPFLAELSARVGDFSLRDGRPRHLIAESDLNDTRVLRAREQGGYGMDAQWLDDFHHCVDAILNQGKSEYARDYGSPSQLLKAYREGYVYSGEYCPFRDRRFGRSSADRAGKEFVVFIQNHDQVGNRLTGDRLSSLVDFESAKLAAGALLVSPYIPLLFMGEEYGETNPFLFFADYGDEDLRQAVREGRKREFNFMHATGEVPDPMGEDSFAKSRLDWNSPGRDRHRVTLEFYRTLLRMRRELPALRRLDRDRMEANMWDGVLFLRRWIARPGGEVESDVACLLNFNPAPSRRRLQAGDVSWSLLFDSADQRWEGPGSVAAANPGGGEEVYLQPRSFVVYRRAGV